jgi:hypothetical protein
MLIIEDKIISLDLFDQHFACDIGKCKGACCIEGDFGAPLEEEEIETLEEIIPVILPRLSDEGVEAVKKNTAVYYNENESMGTPLLENGACAFMRFDANGVAKCTIEEAYQAGEISFRKPISCHLYPVRIKSDPEKEFEAINYDKWDICNAACSKGGILGIKVYEFAKVALIRKYGASFYEALEAADQHYAESKGFSKDI